MKKIILVVIAAVVLFTLVGCESESAAEQALRKEQEQLERMEEALDYARDEYNNMKNEIEKYNELKDQFDNYTK